MHLVEAVQEAVVHEQPAAVSKWMAVGLLDGASDGGPDVRQEQRRLDMPGEIAQVCVVPRGLDAAVAARRVLHPGHVPAEPEPVPVGGLRAHARVQALVDQPVLGAEQHLIEHERLADIGIPATHMCPKIVPRRASTRIIQSG